MKSLGKTVALVVAAGSGTRAGDDLPKQYRRLAGKPLLTHAIEHLRHSSIDEVRVVIGAGHEPLYAEAAAGFALAEPTVGGATRQQSVRQGLEAMASAGGAGAILIHDAARPFLPGAVIDRLVGQLRDTAGAVPALPVVDSLAFADAMLGDAVPREGLARVQTPQAFRFDAILEAHRAWAGEADATDDAQVARANGIEIAAVEGDPMLEKITYADDFHQAERRLAEKMISRTGLGFDVHALASGEELWLGGLLIPHPKGLKGHSDADVALHALTDALLGALGAGDIGDHFPPTDPKWRGAASAQFLEHARDLILGRGGTIDHVDLTIICEAPKIGPHKQALKAKIAQLLAVAPDQVSIKATTTERLGFAGRGEGIAAQAVATIRLPERR